MKKYLSAALIATLTIGSIIMGSTKAIATAIERGYISVSSTANTEIPPDVVEINIAIHTEDEKSLQKATEENKLISDKVYTTLSTMINKENGDYIKTSNFNASPIYSYKNNKRILTKYEVSNSIIVHTKAIKDAGKMIDKAIALGATNINNLTFSVSEHDEQCNELLSIAAKKAFNRANVMAKTSGNTLDGIKSMNGSCSTSTPSRPQYLMAKNLSLDSATGGDEGVTSSSPIQGGVVKLFANLNATYFVK